MRKVEHKSQMETANNIILNFSYQDIENREIVFTKEFEPIVLDKLEKVFNGKVPMKIKFRVDSKEYGEVLNRFQIQPISQVVYVPNKGVP